MAFSVATNRSRSQDSPMLWLSLLAGSLALHLALLLIGRWYLAQKPNVPAGNPQAPLDFVELDPNAAPLKDAKPIAPSNTPTQTALPKAAPPATPEQSQPSTIESTRQTVPEQPPKAAKLAQPQTAPLPSSAPSQRLTPRSQPEQLSPKQPGQLSPKQPSTNPNPPKAPTTPTEPTSGGNNPPANPDKPDPGSPEKPPTSPTEPESPLSITTNLRGEVYGTLEEVGYRPQQFARGSVTLKPFPQDGITFSYPSKIPVSVLDLQLGLSITNTGEVVDVKVLDESPSLHQDSRLRNSKVKQDIESIASGFIMSLAFNVNLDSSGRNAYRIMKIRLYIKQ